MRMPNGAFPHLWPARAPRRAPRLPDRTSGGRHLRRDRPAGAGTSWVRVKEPEHVFDSRQDGVPLAVGDPDRLGRHAPAVAPGSTPRGGIAESRRLLVTEHGGRTRP